MTKAEFLDKYGTRGCTLALNIASNKVADEDLSNLLREIATDLRSMLEEIK
jgi:hypothetical protein